MLAIDGTALPLADAAPAPEPTTEEPMSLFGNLFGAKSAKKQAQATVDAANAQAVATAQAAVDNRAAAEAQAKATADAASAQSAAADRQTAAISEQSRQYQEASANQARQMTEQGDAQRAAFADQKLMMEGQAASAKEAAAQQAQDQRDAAQAAQQGRESDIARNVAQEKAKDALKRPNEVVDVTLASDVQNDSEIDPDTGRRRPVRAGFMASKQQNSGISI